MTRVVEFNGRWDKLALQLHEAFQLEIPADSDIIADEIVHLNYSFDFF